MIKLIETSLGKYSVSGFLQTGFLWKTKEMNWERALAQAIYVGGRFRLPKLEECIVLHNETNAFDDLGEGWVLWCLDEYEENADCSYIYDCSGLLTGHWNKQEKFNAVSVRRE
jgi:hypothetical protein